MYTDLSWSSNIQRYNRYIKNYIAKIEDQFNIFLSYIKFSLNKFKFNISCIFGKENMWYVENE